MLRSGTRCTTTRFLPLITDWSWKTSSGRTMQRRTTFTKLWRASKPSCLNRRTGERMNNVLLEGLTPLLVDAFIVVVGAIIAAVGVELRKVQKANADDTRFAFLQRVAEVGVQAAEQLYGEFAGDAKRDYALDYVESKLAEAGIKVETDLIVAQIEAAVLREVNFPAVEP